MEADLGTLVWEPDETNGGGTVTVVADVEFEGFMYKSDVYVADEDKVSILQFDWNDHMAFVGLSRRARLRWQVTVDEDGTPELSFEDALPSTR